MRHHLSWNQIFPIYTSFQIGYVASNHLPVTDISLQTAASAASLSLLRLSQCNSLRLTFSSLYFPYLLPRKQLSISNRRESCPAVVPTNNWRLRSPSSSDCHSPLSSSPVTSSYFNAYYQKSNSSSLRAAVESAKIKRLQRTRPYSESTVQEMHTSLNNRCASWTHSQYSPFLLFPSSHFFFSLSSSPTINVISWKLTLLINIFFKHYKPSIKQTQIVNFSRLLLWNGPSFSR